MVNLQTDLNTAYSMQMRQYYIRMYNTILYSAIQHYFFDCILYTKLDLNGNQSHGNSLPLSLTAPSLCSAGRGGTFMAERTQWAHAVPLLTVVYLCNKWNIHRRATLTARSINPGAHSGLSKPRSAHGLASLTTTSESSLGPADQ